MTTLVATLSVHHGMHTQPWIGGRLLQMQVIALVALARIVHHVMGIFDKLSGVHIVARSGF